MDSARRQMLERVEHNWERQLKFLSGLIKRPSVLGDEARVQRFVAEELRGMGLDVDVWQIDHASIARMAGYSPVEWSYEGRPNVAATWRSSWAGGRYLIFNGHVDLHRTGSAVLKEPAPVSLTYPTERFVHRLDEHLSGA